MSDVLNKISEFDSFSVFHQFSTFLFCTKKKYVARVFRSIYFFFKRQLEAMTQVTESKHAASRRELRLERATAASKGAQQAQDELDKKDEDEQEVNEEIDSLALAAVHADTEKAKANRATAKKKQRLVCLLYTSPSPRD